MNSNASIISKKYDYFVMVGPGSDYGHQMWKDLSTITNCFYSDNVLVNKNAFLKFLHHLHFSFAINKWISLPFQSIWDKAHFISSIPFDCKKRYCVIFTDISACRTSMKLLKKLHSKQNVDLILVNVNVFASKAKILNKRMALFDKIYSFDRGDCEKYNWLFYSKFYSSDNCVKNSNDELLYDALFVGHSKGRAKILSLIADKIAGQGLKPCFYIAGVKRKEQTSHNVVYNKKIDYDKVLYLAKRSKCIIEMLAKGQEGTTLRYVEAVCLNKLFMTNNTAVLNEKYFESGNIALFNNENDFDVSFLKRKSISNYNYNNEFSPIHFIEELCK